VTKDAENLWSVLKPEVFTADSPGLGGGWPLFREEEDKSTRARRILETDSETVAMIKELLDMRVRPATMKDGGDIEHREFTDESIVRLKLKGGCRGCDSSTVTLKTGIECILMHYIPEVNGTEQVRISAPFLVVFLAEETLFAFS